jgi:hypothetical protein
MNRLLPLALGVSVVAVAGQASAKCHLQSARGDIRHVVYITFDNLHLTRDNPNVPSDLEQMPHLLDRLSGRGTVLSRHHTPLISHTSTDLLTALTGVYGDRHGVSIGNSFRYFNPDGTSSSAGSFTYWTDPLDITGKNDKTTEMLGPDGKNAPAPWVAYTRAGCDVGAVASANIVLENTTNDITTVFGTGSPEAVEAQSNGNQATSDFVGIAVHCAAGSALCANGRPDLLPDEAGGYTGFNGLFGHKYVAQALATPIADLDGNALAGFPGFDGMSASVSLGYIATLLEHGVPVTYAYISDAHDNHSEGRAFGPGEAGYVAQLAAYDAAFAKFFDRLDRDGIDDTNTLFVFTADEGDHFVGGAPSPANCDGVHTPCTYAQIGELNANLTGLLAAAGITTSWKAHSDSAPNLWVQGNPAADSPVVRALDRALAALQVVNPLTNASEKMVNYLADATEMKLLHMVTADPQRTPTVTAFARPDYYVYGGPPSCGGPCVVEQPAFAWNHGDVSKDINVTWLGMMGPGVERGGVDGSVWSDHADVRPTILALIGLRDSYVHQGRVLAPALKWWAQPNAWASHGDRLERLARAYKQLNAPIGRLGLASLKISTKSLASGDANGDESFGELTTYLTSVSTRRDQLAAKIEQMLDDATYGSRHLDDGKAWALTLAADQLTDEVRAVAAYVEMLP